MSKKGILALCLLCVGLSVAAYAAVINCAGNVVNNAKNRVQDHDPALAWNGRNFGMVWVTDGDNLMFALLAADGKRVGGPRLLYDAHVPFTGYTVQYPDIVWTGSSFLIVYSHSHSYYSFQVGADGSILNGPTSLKTETSVPLEYAGCLAWNGTEAGLVYVNQDTKVFFKRLSKTGALVGQTVLIAPNSGHGYFRNPLAKIAWNGREYGIAWSTKDAKGINFQAVSSAGATIGSRTSLAKTSGQFNHLSLCPGMEGSYAFGMAYTEYVMNVRTVVYFTQVASDGTLLHKAVNVRGVPRTSRFTGDYPHVAWNKDRGVFHVSWQDNRVAPEPDPGITSYYNFFTRTIKPTGKFASAETMLNIKFKDQAYNTLESGAAFGGGKLCIGFSKSLGQSVTDPNLRHYRAHSVCVKPR